jgi:putative glutamine amidotransferase
MLRLPLIGVTACTKQVGLHLNHIVGDKYVRAVAVGAEGLPLVIPALGELIDQPALLASIDGLLFTGSPSNVEPHHYSGPAATAWRISGSVVASRAISWAVPGSLAGPL